MHDPLASKGQLTRDTSLALPSTAYTACLLGSGAPLHSSCCPWPLSHVLASPKCWSFLLQLGCTFTNCLLWALFRDSDLITWCQASTSLSEPFNPEASATEAVIFTNGLSWGHASAALQDPFMLPKLIPPDRLSHITKFSC